MDGKSDRFICTMEHFIDKEEPVEFKIGAFGTSRTLKMTACQSGKRGWCVRDSVGSARTRPLVSSAVLTRHAQQFMRVALQHHQCLEVGIVSVNDDEARVFVVIHVEMPLAFANDGQSPNGVRVKERAEIVLGPRYPSRSPGFCLREDFPRDLPHLLSAGGKRPPQPCLVDGSVDEFFNSFGLVEVGIMQLLTQLGTWLERAAINTLMDAAHGWETIIRHDLEDMVIADPLALSRHYSKGGGAVWLHTRFAAFKAASGSLDGYEYSLIVGDDLAPMIEKYRKSRFKSTRSELDYSGETITAVFWPPEDVITKDIMADNIRHLDGLAARAEAVGCGQTFRRFLPYLDTHWSGYQSDATFPIGVIFAVRRPFALTGRATSIELFAYIFLIDPKAKRKTLFEGATGRTVVEARPLERITRRLLREYRTPMISVARLSSDAAASDRSWLSTWHDPARQSQRSATIGACSRTTWRATR